MKVLVVGGGGREHTVIRKLKENPEITQIFALPGNGGMAQDAECVPIDAKDIASIVTFAVSNDIDYAVVGGCRNSLFRSPQRSRHHRRQQGLLQKPDEEIRHPHRAL